MSKIMGKREARKWLFEFAAQCLLNNESCDTITDRVEDHNGDEKAADKETAILHAEMKYVAERIRKLAK